MHLHPAVEKFYHRVLVVAAIIIVFCAVVFTITRALTPLVNLKKERFEHLASQMLGVPITFSRVKFGWHGIEPEMSLQDAAVYRKNSNKEIFHVNHLYIALDIFHSILARKILPAFITASGMWISVEQEKNGGYEINDLRIKGGVDGGQSGLKSSLLRAWLLAQDRVHLQNISIKYHSLRSKKIKLMLKALDLVNANQYHQLSAVFSIFKQHPVNIKLIMQAKGDLTDLKTLQAKLYLNLAHVDLANVAVKKSLGGYFAKSGVGNDQVWLTWCDDQWCNVVNHFHFYNLVLQSKTKAKQFQLKNLSGSFDWKRTNNGWQFGLDDLRVITRQAVWPKAQFNLTYAKLQNKPSWSGDLSFVNIADLREFIAGSSFVPSKIKNQLARFSPSGIMENIQFSSAGALSDLSNYHFNATINNLSTSPWHRVPRINNLSGQIEFTNASGVFHMNSKDLELGLNYLFVKPLVFNQVKGDVLWKKHKGILTIKTNKLLAANNDFGIYGQFALRFMPGSSQPYLSLLTGFYTKNPAALKKYIPKSGLSQGARQWLKSAVIGGRSLTGKVILRGNLKYFPFKDNRGVFQVQAQFKGVDLRFSRRWPILSNVSGDLLFENNSLMGEVKAGRILGSVIDDAWINIPALSNAKNPYLAVTADVVGNGKQVANFVYNSPLKVSLGKVFDQIQLVGQTNLRLHIKVPLLNVRNTTVLGKLSLIGDQLNLPRWFIPIKAFNGVLNFTGKSVSANSLKGILYGEPIVANISTINNTDSQSIDINFNSIASIKNLQKSFPWLKAAKLYGSVKYNGALQFNFSKLNSRPSAFLLHSDMYGLNSAYPSPFNMPFAAIKPLSLKAEFGGHTDATKLFVNYGHSLHAALMFNASGFYSGLVRFGDSNASIQQKKGLIVVGTIPRFDLKAWQAVFSLNAKSISSNHTDALMNDKIQKLLRHVDLHISDVSALGIDLGAAEFKLSFAHHDWLAGIDSKVISGSVSIPDNFPKTKITGSFARFYLPAFHSASQEKFNPGSIPPLKIQVVDFRYANKNFGKVSFDVFPKSNAIKIKNLTLSSQQLSANVHGEWSLNAGKYQTYLAGWVSSDDISLLLHQWGVKSNLILTSGKAVFDLSWPAAPYVISPSLFVGHAAVKLGHGWYVGLSKSEANDLDLGRAINMLSIRHLLLNFNDVSHKGYSFDHLLADLSFDTGLITTNDFQTTGSVANIHMKGEIDLLKKYIDMKLAVIVDATGSLPLIATVASGFNPIVGAATWVVDKLVNKAIDHSYRYSKEIVGQWNNPKVVKLQ